MAKQTKIYLTDDEKSEIIQLWEGEDVLYDIEHADYHNNAKRLAALKRVAELMSIEITHVQVKASLKSLRTSFLKERHKAEDSKGTGKGANEIYTSWELYDELKFLLPYTRPVNTESSLSQNLDRLSDTDDVDLQINENEEDNYQDPEADGLFDAVGEDVTLPKNKKSKNRGNTSIWNNNGRKRKPNSDDVLMKLSGTLDAVAKRSKPMITTPPPPPPPPREDDPEDLFGKTMAFMARQIQDDMSREMAKIECQQIMLRYRVMITARGPPARLDVSSNAGTAQGFGNTLACTNVPMSTPPSNEGRTYQGAMFSSGNTAGVSTYRMSRAPSSPISVNTAASHAYDSPVNSPCYNGSYMNNQSTPRLYKNEGFINIVSPISESPNSN